MKSSNEYMYELNPLLYSYDALEPIIDAETMRLHHDKHHQGYVDKLNAALTDYPELTEQPVEELIKIIKDLPTEVQLAVRNHGGGHANHNHFWHSMRPVNSKEGDRPTGQLAQAIDACFGLTSDLEAAFSAAAVGIFGSGWAWLITDNKGELEIVTTANQDNPLMTGLTKKNGIPVLGVDVWEHAYYLKYQNRRADYLQQWWQLVNWAVVSDRYDQAQKT